MRRLAIFVLALAFGAPACDDDNPVGPSNSGPIVFTAELRASNEVPAIAGAEANGQGTATITFNVPRDASGNITGDGTWNVQAVLSGLTDTTMIRLAHIHNGAAGVNAGVWIDTMLTPANAIPTPGGSATINFEGVFLLGTRAQTVLDNPAGNYFNMHSNANPGGVVRGQLVRVQ
jgi:CHRD domain